MPSCGTGAGRGGLLGIATQSGVPDLIQAGTAGLHVPDCPTLGCSILDGDIFHRHVLSGSNLVGGVLDCSIMDCSCQ